MARARLLVILIFIASETLVLGDSIPVKVPVRDEVTNVKESDKQKPSLSNSRIDIPPNKGMFRVIKSVSSSVSSLVSRSDGEHSDKKIKNVGNATGTADEDTERGKSKRRFSGEQIKEATSDIFNFDDFLISVTSKNDIKIDTNENVHNKRAFPRREPVKPMPTKIAIPKWEIGVTIPAVNLEHKKEDKFMKETPIINATQFTKNESEFVDSVLSFATQVKRRRPVVMRKNKRRILVSPNSPPKSDQILNSKWEAEVDEQVVKNSTVKTTRSPSRSRNPTILSENIRRKLFPSRRNLTRGITRKLTRTQDKGSQKLQVNDINFVTTSVASTTTIPSVATIPTSTITESPVSEIADADYWIYEELYDQAPPEPRYTPKPKLINNRLLQKVSMERTFTSPLKRPSIFQATVTSANQIPSSKRDHSDPQHINSESENSFQKDEADHLITSFQDALTDRTNPREKSKLSQTPNSLHTNAESSTDQRGITFPSDESDSKGTEAIPHHDISALPEQFDYTNYEDLIEFYDYPEDYLVNDNSGANIYDNFQYGYKVAEKVTGNYHARTENRDGKKVSGTYEVTLPDGRIQLVNYVADDEGFRADVTYKKDNRTSTSELPKITSFANNGGQLEKPKVTSTVNRNRVKLSNSSSTKSKKKLKAKSRKSHVSSFDDAHPTESPIFISKNSHMTPHPALHKSNKLQQRPRGKSIGRGNAIVNAHFDSVPNIHTPVSFNTKNEVSSILQNHGLLNPSRNIRPEPIPKPIPPHGHREVARVPPNPFNKKPPKKKSHVPVKPQPKLISTIAPTQPPVHPLLKPGAFNRPVHIDRKPEVDFPVTEPPLPFPPQHSTFAFPENSLHFDGDHLPERHFEPHNNFANPLIRRPIDYESIFRKNQNPAPKQLRINQKKKGKINFSEDFPVTTTSPNPFKVVVERIRPSTINRYQTHFITPRTSFPLSYEQTSESPFLNQPNYSDIDLRELPNIELFKTPVNEPYYYENTGVYSNVEYPVTDEELFHRTTSYNHFAIPIDGNPITTPRPFFTFSNEKFPSVSTEKPAAITPKSIFRQNNFGLHFTTAAPAIRISKFVTTSVPNNRVTGIIPLQSMAPISPPSVHFPFITTPAPIQTTTRSRPIFFNYLSKNGTPTPTLVYHPDNPIFIHALGQTHAIPLLLPYEGSASEKSETKVNKTERRVNSALPGKKLKFNKSDIYPEPPIRLSIK